MVTKHLSKGHPRWNHYPRDRLFHRYPQSCPIYYIYRPPQIDRKVDPPLQHVFGSPVPSSLSWASRWGIHFTGHEGFTGLHLSSPNSMPRLLRINPSAGLARAGPVALHRLGFGRVGGPGRDRHGRHGARAMAKSLECQGSLKAYRLWCPCFSGNPPLVPSHNHLNIL